jgi:hypothetical protein
MAGDFRTHLRVASSRRGDVCNARESNCLLLCPAAFAAARAAEHQRYGSSLFRHARKTTILLP